MASTSDFRNGLCIKYNNDIYQIVEFQHVKPGKGGAFVRTKLKSLTNKRVIDNTFNAGVKVDDVRVERRKFQFLYNDDAGYHFMNSETYDQVALQEDFVPNPGLLKEGLEVDVVYHAEDETPLFCEMPTTIELAITYTEPGVKGDTATNTLKPATLETGATVNVPLFIKEGEVIKVNSLDNSYQGRA